MSKFVQSYQKATGSSLVSINHCVLSFLNINIDFTCFAELFLEPTDNIYRGIGETPYLNGQVRIAFIRGNDILEKTDGIPLDGKILQGMGIVAPGDNVREITKRSVCDFQCTSNVQIFN